MTGIVMTKETKPRDPILKKYAKRIDENRFKIDVTTNLQEIGMQGYERYTRMSDGVQKIDPEILHNDLSIFKAGIITDVTPLQYDIRKDRWTYTMYVYGVFNGELTPKEIVRNYYLKGHGINVGED
jgi:hypothetical protein|nr:MAG TPA: hypothetical protein [Caudoviricetes sp.]